MSEFNDASGIEPVSATLRRGMSISSRPPLKFKTGFFCIPELRRVR